MSIARTDRITTLLTRITRVRDSHITSDGQLLADYIRSRDTTAFETLLRRHGPMVFGVCRRMLRNEPDAEDAFQATFLVLIRRADTVKPRNRVGNWLYGVAVRTALKLRSAAATRLGKERLAARSESAEPFPMAITDWEPILDEELARLPEKYREPIVLCDVRGISRSEAALALGWPEGSVAGRLARARALLAERLRKRGVTLCVGMLATLVTGRAAPASVSSGCPTRLLHLHSVDGPASAGNMASMRSATLATEVVKGMTLASWSTVLFRMMLVASFGLGTAAALLAGWSRTADPDRTPPVDVNPSSAAEEPRKVEPKSKPMDLNKMWSQGKAVGKGPVKFTHSPMRVEDIEKVLPYGLMVGAHVAPIDHGYFFPKAIKAGQPHFTVVAPADGFVVIIGHRVQLAGSTETAREYDDFALTIEHSATFYTQYDLLTALSPALLKHLDAATLKRFKDRQPGPVVNVRVPVKAGDAIGTVAGRSLDFGAVNNEQTLKGILTPELYGHYGWRVHLADPYAHFEEPLRGELLKLNPRTAEPRCGRIDYDVDGKAVGNWFKEGTGGYAGNKDRRGYWMGHLALAYHAIDPTQVIVSVGDFGGRPRQFAVVGNGPDPGKVAAKDGVVKYELQYAPINNRGEKMELPREMRGVQGTLLIQVMDNRKLKAEAFPGRAAKDVTGFTPAAAIYER